MMMSLPEEFVSYTRELFGEDRWQRYLAAFDEEPPVSVRVNPFKTADSPLAVLSVNGATEVPWCHGGYYLDKRPDFTHDPLLHAGAYYVQEASSMFLDSVVRQYVVNPKTVLDLCAAPGGKSTLLRAALPDTALLYSNEPNQGRSNILMENIQKQGHSRVIVTRNYPADYRKAGVLFDAILTDVPCSGEGMFRKDEGAIGEWSLANVMKCQELQRSIVEDIWPCLNVGGILIYSTCTFNTRENEENVRWIMENLGAEILSVEISGDWGITGSLLEGWQEPVCRFIPGTAKGEGLFMAVLRKTGGEVLAPQKATEHILERKKTKGKQSSVLKVLSDGNPAGTQKGKDIIPAHAEALLACKVNDDKYPCISLSLADALRYLHRETLVLPPESPRGIVKVTYSGLPLGFMKNIGNRANNLYPQEWKIRNL